MDKGTRVNKAVKCETCNITLNSEQQAQQHYSGKNHLKKLRQIAPMSSQPTVSAVTPITPKLSAPTIPNPTQQRVPTTNPVAAVATAMASTAVMADNKLDPVSQAVYDNVLGKLPLKRKIQEIPCTVCNIVFNSEAQASAHFTGSRHAKKQKVAEATEEGLDKGVSAKSWGNPFHCGLCNCTLNSVQQMEAHKQGQKHRNKSLSMTKKISTTGRITNSTSWTEISGHEPGWFYCSNCDISVPSAITLQQHTRGDNHKAKLQAKREEEKSLKQTVIKS